MKPLYPLILSSVLLMVMEPAFSDNAHINLPSLKGDVAVQNWKTLRDKDVEKQDEDYSCGSASTATILHSFYGLDIGEKDILARVKSFGGDGTASFEDLARAVEDYGFKGLGMPVSFEQLKSIKIPAIVYLRHYEQDHFSVIRGITEDGTVWLGDPSLGNRKFTEQQFRQMWETRDDEDLKGKILLIIPKDKANTPVNETFFAEPVTNTIGLKLLTIR